MQLFPVALVLTLVTAVQAAVYTVQVGNAQGQTIFNPNQIVSSLQLSLNAGSNVYCS